MKRTSIQAACLPSSLTSRDTTRIWPALPVMLVLTVFALGGCTLAPEYIRPEAPIPNVYPAEEAANTSEMVPWREFFKDPVMQRVIDQALQNNRDLRIAMLNVEKTRSMYRIQQADLLPTVAAGSSSQSQYMPGEFSPLGEAAISRQYTASLGFSGFELDLFGRIRSLTDAAVENYHSKENDARRARLTLVAEVAALYLQTVSDRELRDITEGTYQSRKTTYDMIRRQYETGIASLLAVNQARTGMEEARSSLARLETKVSQGENALTFLVGASLPADLPNVRRLKDVAKLPDVPAGMPSALIERRPDVISAEHLLMAANSNIGAARANFFPRIAITASTGYLSTEFSNLFSGAAESWNLAGQATLPIFDMGRNIANLQGSMRDKDIAIAVYERTIQQAFREVADSLVQRRNIGELIDAQASLLDATRQTYNLAQTRYDVGIDNLLTLLDAQRSNYGAEQAYIGALLLRETNALMLYKALGGGWR